MRKLKHIAIVIGLGLMAVNPTLVMAQPAVNTNAPTNSNSGAGSTAIDVPEYKGVDDSITQFLCTPNEGSAQGAELSKSLESCINKLYRFGIAFGAIALVFFIVLAGYFYITGGESGKGKAKTIIQNALVGMSLLLGSYVLLTFINPSLTILKPIQPPIFDAADLPSCDQVGFGENCVVPSTGGISTGGGGKCSAPIAESSLNGTFNNTLHNKPGHGPLRAAPNSPSASGIVDIGGKGGSPVYSPISGKVVHKQSLKGNLGDYVSIISDPNGGSHDCGRSNECANMAHIDFSVKEGDMVTSGQQIGVLTNYSCSRCMGPHLHLELKLGGNWVTGDGFKGTWTNMKTACAASGSNSSGGGGGSSSAVAVDINPTGMVEVTAASHGVIINMKYATADNFTGTVLYKQNKCYLTPTMASQLKVAQTALTAKGKKLEILDCYRPRQVQDLMVAWAKGKVSWAAKQAPQPNDYLSVGYIATGGNHPLGKAIDLTISGASMTSAFDKFDTTAHYKASNADGKLLRDTMTAAEFTPVRHEWWHFGE